MPSGWLVPNQGWCFGSRFLGAEDKRLFEILPESYFGRVRNVWNFWLAWIVDVCADHADHRQALFEEGPDRQLNPFFIDHGHLFGGPKGDLRRGLRTSRYLDARIYQDLSPRNISTILTRLRDLNVDVVWQRAMELPDEWKTKTALDSLSECLNRLSQAQLMRTLVDEVIEVHEKRSTSCEHVLDIPSVLRPGVPTAARGFSRTEREACNPVCAL
jgi:hypothetical protein